MKPTPRCFAVIPAAGHSRRMQPQNKLLLAWAGQTVIDQVLDVWASSLVDKTVIVIRRADHKLQQICRLHAGIDVVLPKIDPEDMKASIQAGLKHIATTLEPAPSDRWLVAPADLPTLAAAVIDELVKASRGSTSIVVPRFGGHRGHPVSFPWLLSGEVFELRSDQGIDQLVAAGPTQWLDFPAQQRPLDIDTPEDYRRIKGQRDPD